MTADPLPEPIRRRFTPVERYGLRVTLFALAVFLLAVPFAVLLQQVVGKGPLTSWDVEIANRIHTAARHNDIVLAAMQVLSFLGKPIWFYGIVGAACAFLWVKTRRRRPVVYLVVTSLVGGAIDTAVKVLVNRPRPTFDEPIAHAFGKSFPSGHSFTSLVIYGALLLVFIPIVARAWRPWLVALYVLLVAGIGFSRLVLGVHYVSDVLGGWTLGGAWLASATAAFSIWRVEEGAPPVHVLEGAEPEAADELLD